MNKTANGNDHMDREQPVKKKKLIGVIGGIFVFGAFMTLCALPNYDWYKYCLSDFDPAWIPLRYAVSWAQRLVGLIAGFGLIAHRRWAAQIVVYLSIFNILTVYWKYPYQSFIKQSIILNRDLGGMFAGIGVPEVNFTSHVMAAVVSAYLIDFLFFGFVVFYLTRPQVKETLK